jgi:hypothetical protein
MRQGYLPKNIYLLSHSKQRNETLVENTDGNQIGIMEEGVFTAFANLFLDRGGELRAKLRAMGIAKDRAELLEAGSSLSLRIMTPYLTR